ncbi:long-chain-fatty-acid--CoA ligase ACSBG1-like [Alligator sinensis]|uniref:Long-chain-fatty-acid--CoA ligase ACSBG1-like n=1 Tax=Alligator sinensis TaxID=38654 RepID=A0A3Q0FPM7_ALLSI|nr:long-chain-fatty-acid--CoA ligase ACSBG1-like [Alligator sinensis]
MAARRAGCWLKSRLCQAWLKGSWQLPAPHRFHAGGCSGPVAPAETLFTTRADEAVRLRLDPEGPGALPPITVHQLFQAAVEHHGDQPALAYKRGQTWESLSYRQYQQQGRGPAKGFLKTDILDIFIVCSRNFPSAEIKLNRASFFPFLKRHYVGLFPVLNNLTHLASLHECYCQRLQDALCRVPPYRRVKFIRLG